MYIKDARDVGFGDWISSSEGLVFTIGAVAAIAAFFEGMLEIGRNVEKMVHIGDGVVARGGPPTPEEGPRWDVSRRRSSVRRRSTSSCS
jgi:hypothetical protein